MYALHDLQRQSIGFGYSHPGGLITGPLPNETRHLGTHGHEHAPDNHAIQVAKDMHPPAETQAHHEPKPHINPADHHHPMDGPFYPQQKQMFGTTVTGEYPGYDTYQTTYLSVPQANLVAKGAMPFSGNFPLPNFHDIHDPHQVNKGSHQVLMPAQNPYIDTSFFDRSRFLVTQRPGLEYTGERPPPPTWSTQQVLDDDGYTKPMLNPKLHHGRGNLHYTRWLGMKHHDQF